MRCLVLVLVACGSTQRAPAHTSEPKPAPPDAGVVAVQAPQVPTDAECAAQIGHLSDLVLAEQPHADLLDDEDRAKLRNDLIARFTPACKQLTLEQLRCGMAAKTVADFDECQRVASSSTSNRSVAPPGITPPAPRSP